MFGVIFLKHYGMWFTLYDYNCNTKGNGKWYLIIVIM